MKFLNALIEGNPSQESIRQLKENIDIPFIQKLLEENYVQVINTLKLTGPDDDDHAL